VILADTMTPPAGPRHPRLLTLGGKATVWAGRKADDAPAVAAARRDALAEAEHEYRRLLYVAMTRAADRLIVAGAEGERKRPNGCWYDLVYTPLQPLLIEEDDNGEIVFRYRKPAASGKRAATTDSPKQPDRREFPSWLRESAPAEAPRAAPLSPSSAFEDEIGRIAQPGASAGDRQKALERGRIVHRLLQSLPDIAPARRIEAAKRYLGGAAASGFSDEERSAMARQVLAILNAEEFAPIFAPGSRAEVPIVGRIPRPRADPRAVAGQVDRVIVTEGAVLIADYKTDRMVPSRLAEVPPPYIAQLALYRAVLARIYPEKVIRAALVFSSGPSLIAVPENAMDAALADVLRRDLIPSI
jgi:ATP-dependent helicase/nuclease subunit A